MPKGLPLLLIIKSVIMNQRFAILIPLLFTFFILAVVIFSASVFLKNEYLDFVVLMAANCLFFLMSLITFRIQKKAMENSNPNAFVRSVMGGVMIKMFACIGAIMAYFLMSGKNFNKPAVFISMVLYLVYLVVEVALLMKLNKRKNA